MAITATAHAAAETANVRIDRVQLRRKRQLKGYTYQELAAKAKISFGYVGQLERGVRDAVSPPVFVRLCDALGLQDRTELLAKDAQSGGSL